MNSDDRFLTDLGDYLHEFDGETPLPRHVRDAIRAELPGTRQVDPRPGPWRVLTMMSKLSAPARLGLATVVLVAAVALAGAFMGARTPEGVGAPAASAPDKPLPSAQPSSTASASDAPSPVGGIQVMKHASVVPCGEPGGCLAPGTYSLDPFDMPKDVSFEVPDGWWSYDEGAGVEGLLVDVGPDAPSGSGWGIVMATVGEVRRDPCDAAAGTFHPDAVDTPEKLADAMRAWPGFDVSTPEAIALGGARGVIVVATTTDDLGSCPFQVAWRTPQLTDVDAYPLGGGDPGQYSTVFRILEVGDELLVIRTTNSAQTSPFEVGQGVEPDPDRHAEHLAEQQAIIDSIRFGARTP